MIIFNKERFVKAPKYAKYERVRTNEERWDDRTLTMVEVYDVLELVAHGEWPNGSFSDDECALWSKVHDVLDIPRPRM